VRNIETIFNDGGGDKDVGFATDEFEHYFLKIFFAHLAVADDDAGLRDKLYDQGGERIDGLNTVVDEIDLAIARKLILNGLLDDVFVKRSDDGLDGETIAGSGFDHGHIAQAD